MSKRLPGLSYGGRSLADRYCHGCGTDQVRWTNLDEIIPDAFKTFDYNNWWDGEDKILKPALAAIGYENIRFFKGETDSFGPLSRKCTATYNGHTFHFYYN